MGQGISCREPSEHGVFSAVYNAELETLEAMVDEDPSLLELTSGNGRLSTLHVAAANGRIEVLSMLLDRSANPDILNRRKHTPLMLAAMHGKLSCVERLIQAEANVLMFDSLNARTCMHYAAYYGHSECLKLILSAANSSPVAHSWGFARFVNIRDGNGATPLHLAARQKQAECVRVLLGSGALVCASTGGYSCPGSSPLHLAARGGSLDCVRELLAWGADRLQTDASGRIPYMVALKYKHGSCAALLNPSAPEPLTWPAPLKFIRELNPEAKVLLENALIEANKERENTILKETAYSNLPLDDTEAIDVDLEASEVALCRICFEQTCTIEVQQCGHQMCARCILALCCCYRPSPSTNSSKAPVCPFCRRSISQLVVVKINTNSNMELEFSPSQPRSSRKSVNLNERGSSSFKSLSSLGSFGKVGRNSGKVAADCDDKI